MPELRSARRRCHPIVGRRRQRARRARIAIRDTLYEAPFGVRGTGSVSHDFYFGFGTALSPGLPMLVAQAGVTATLAGPAPAAREGMHVLAGFGFLYAIGQLAEPLAHRTLAHPRSAGAQRLRVVVGNIVLPAAMADRRLQGLSVTRRIARRSGV